VKCAEEYSKVAAERNPTVHVAFIRKEDISELQPSLTEKWSSVQGIPKTQRLHCFKPVNSLQIAVAEFSTSEFHTHNIRRPAEQDDVQENQCDVHVEEPAMPQVGQWVIVDFEGTEYPGEVLRVVADKIEVSVMHKFGAHWKWPKDKDCIAYTLDEIMQIIKPPKAGSRGRFNFDF
jgi:hypothetical protein